MCTGCSKEEKRKVNILNWSSYIPGDVILDFEKETGIDVNYGTYSSNEELLAKVSVAKEGTYDLIFPSDYMVEIMISRGLIQEIDKSMLENVNNLNIAFMNKKYDYGNQYTLPFLAATTVIAVNREIVKDDIKSYNDLLDLKYKNEIVLIDDQRIIIGMALLANGYDMNSINKDELEVAKNWLFKLKKNLKAFDSDSPKNFLISNEASIAVLWNAEGALASMQNSDIENIFPLEGVAVSIDNFAIPKGAKNKEELYQFIDYILRPEVMKRIVSSYPYKSVNRETDNLLGWDYLSNQAVNISSSVFDRGLFVENIGSNISMYDKIWAEIK
jgi:spermidine/putrescine transport system substrate-binding protein/spermidine/putrescine transport system permease protein